MLLITNRDVIIVKVANHLKVIWAIDNKLHTHKIHASVIYVVEDVDVDETIRIINNSLTNENTKS